MKKGAYALIFFFWAFLTIITPTLVQWSAAAAAAATGDSQSKEDITAGKESSRREALTIARKMMKLTQEIGLQGMRKAPPQPPPVLGVAVSSPPAPAPAPEVVLLLGEGSNSKLVSTSRRLFLRGL